MMQYKVTFHLSCDRIEMVCDTDTLCDALNRLSKAQVDDIFMHILFWRMRNGDREDTEDLMSYLFLNFVDDTPVGYIKMDLIHADLEWILDSMDRDPQPKSYYDDGIQVEVVG